MKIIIIISLFALISCKDNTQDIVCEKVNDKTTTECTIWIDLKERNK